MCDPYEQDCGEGRKCVWYANISTQQQEFFCVDVTGNRKLGETCMHDGILLGTDDCDGDGSCWGAAAIFQPWTGICRPFCKGTVANPLCDLPGEECAGGELPLCLPKCDPLAQDCPGGGETCWYRPETGGFVCTPSTQIAGVGDNCFLSYDCQSGLVCMDNSVVPGCQYEECCTELCDLNGGTTCTLEAQGAECVALSTKPEIMNVGACILPG